MTKGKQPQSQAKRPSREAIAQRLAPFGLTPEDIQVPPLVVASGTRIKLGSCSPVMSAYRRKLPQARDFHHLKEMIGIPNHVFEGRTDDRIFQVDEADVVNEGIHELHRRCPSPSAAHKMAVNLLFRYADPDLVEQAPYRDIIQLLLGMSASLSGVFGSDLIVEDNATVELPQDDPIVYFDTITIIGSGQIIVGPVQKVISEFVEHVPASA